MRHITRVACGLLMIAMAACQPNPLATTPIPTKPTLVGAFVPTRIATETATFTPSATFTATATGTSTPTRTPTATPSDMPTATSTATATPSITNTATATLTPSVTLSPTVAPTGNGTTRIQGNDAATPIAVTDGTFTHESEITDDAARIHFIFDGQAGDVVNIEMQVISGDLDPYLILTNAAGEVILENDDDPLGVGRDAYIHDFELPETGSYIVIATRLEQEEGNTDGGFALTIERSGTDVALATAEPTSEVGDDNSILVCDQTISETINDEHYTWRFSFDADAGQVVGIQMTATSGDLDSIVRLLNADEDLLAENDDDEENVGKDAFLRDLQIPETGTYIVEASRFQDDLGTTAGDFDLTLVCTSGT